jgi:hypothetical protein
MLQQQMLGVVNVCTAQNVGGPAKYTGHQGSGGFVNFQGMFKDDGGVTQDKNRNQEAVNHGGIYLKTQR